MNGSLPVPDLFERIMKKVAFPRKYFYQGAVETGDRLWWIYKMGPGSVAWADTLPDYHVRLTQVLQRARGGRSIEIDKRIPGSTLTQGQVSDLRAGIDTLMKYLRALPDVENTAAHGTLPGV